MPKVLLRKSILKRRLALSATEQVAASTIIQDTFMALPEYQFTASVALYVAVHNEVSTEKVFDQALLAGKALFLPAIENGRMLFRRVISRSDLVVGTFGILQPGADSEVVDPAEIECIVVPGVGFDLSGQRIGYGKGYYDRVLHRLEASGRLTAFCYELQLIDSLQGEEHDVVMDRIITERRIITPALLK